MLSLNNKTLYFVPFQISYNTADIYGPKQTDDCGIKANYIVS